MKLFMASSMVYEYITQQMRHYPSLVLAMDEENAEKLVMENLLKNYPPIQNFTLHNVCVTELDGEFTHLFNKAGYHKMVF